MGTLVTNLLLVITAGAWKFGKVTRVVREEAGEVPIPVAFSPSMKA